MLIVVTGAAGFIGSNLVKALNALGFNDIIAVDNLTNGAKFKNLVDCQIIDFVHKEDFIESIAHGDYDNTIDYIFHLGACSDTTEQDGRYMLENNYEYSSIIFDYTQKNEVPLLYASSAAVYGGHNEFIETPQYESPLNVYGYSKLLFDQLVRRKIKADLKSPVVGLRFFNVYGPKEWHKERMASVVLHNFNQYQKDKKVKLFKGCQGYGDGEQKRDFVSVEDVVDVILYFFKNHIESAKEISGIFNCGTGQARSFNDLALATINSCRSQEGLPKLTLQEAVNQNILEYIDFPQDLANKYQCYTQANLDNLRKAGYKSEFLTLEIGIESYINSLYTRK